MAVLGLALLLSACEEEDNSDEIREQEIRFFELYMGSIYEDTIAPPRESGLYYIEVREGDGEPVAQDDWLLVNFVGSTIPQEKVVETYIENVAIENDIYSSNALYGPTKWQQGTMVEGVNEGLSLMKKGGQAILCFDSDLGYGASGASLMKSIGGYTSLKYEIEVLEVIDDIVSWEQERITGYTDSIRGVETVYDTVSEATMYYVIDQPMPDSAQVAPDTIVSVAYKGYLIDGRVFDESEEGSPLSVDLGAPGSVIEGWMLGLLKFREGEKGRLIIPYNLAYGESGYMNGAYVAIPPYETLVFDIEILDMSDDSGTQPEI